MQGSSIPSTSPELPEKLQEVVERYLQRLHEREGFPGSPAAALLDDDDFRRCFHQVCACSDFVAGSLIADPSLLERLYKNTRSGGMLSGDLLGRLRQHLRPLADSDMEEDVETCIVRLKQELRRFHRAEFVEILWRDLSGQAHLYDTCRRVSELADACLQGSLEILHRWSARQWGVPRFEDEREAEQQLVVIAMGKLGAFELNVSSDIDLIFAYPENGNLDLSGRRQDGNSGSPLPGVHQFFTRVGQRLIDVLDSTTSEGFVFRMDMRLRPYGSEGALVQNFDAMEDYYQSQGRDWERYAFTKARVAAGDRVRGEQLLQRLRPFVYRRYLDFAMFESLRDMKNQINRQTRSRKLGDDIKLGQGGIREVEFVVQALQLVHGGRDRNLQVTSTRDALIRLREGGYLPARVTEELAAAYEYLRKLEHRLQALANQQTQKLPLENLQRMRIAFAMGHGSWEELARRLEQVRAMVHAHFREVIRVEEADATAEGFHPDRDWSAVWKQSASSGEALALLKEAGFEDPESVRRQIAEFRNDRKYLLSSQESQTRFDQFMPVLLEAVSVSRRPSLCFSRVMKLMEAVSRRTAYLVLLLENPAALSRLVKYCTESSFITDYLSQYPVLLDELLDVIDTPPDRASLQDELRTQLLRIDENSFEEQLECLRYFKQSHILQVAAAEVSGKMPLMKVSDYLTYTAEVILERVLALSWQHLVSRHGYPVHSDGGYAEPDFAVVGYGKVGGIELSYNSDLDLVFLHRAALDRETVAEDGQRAINSREFYIRLAQRIILTLGTYTISGKLYEVDMRLRPSGESGLLVSSLESFADYQHKNAWTWEHQALVRARGIAGNAHLLQAFLRVRSEVLSKRRDRQALAEEVLKMRRRMRDELKSQSKSEPDKLAFAIKHERGGIVDIEFLVQFLVLAWACEYPALVTWTDNMRILESIEQCELLEADAIASLKEAYLALRAASHLLAIRQTEDVPVQSLAEHKRKVGAIWDKVFASASAA